MKRALGKSTIASRRERKRRIAPPIKVEADPEAMKLLAERTPLYPEHSLMGPDSDRRPHKLPKPVAFIDGYGTRHETTEWKWNDPCPKCGSPTEHGYCTRYIIRDGERFFCPWYCKGSARPKADR